MEVMVNAFMGKYCLFVSHDFPGKSSGLLCIKAADFRRLSGNVILSARRRPWQDVNGDNEKAGFFAYGVAYPPGDSNKCADWLHAVRRQGSTAFPSEGRKDRIFGETAFFISGRGGLFPGPFHKNDAPCCRIEQNVDS